MADELDPGCAVTADGDWLVCASGSFAIRHVGGRTVLVDAGIGPADAPAASWAPVPGRCGRAGRAGIDAGRRRHGRADPPAHRPHRLGDGASKPFFPNAR